MPNQVAKQEQTQVAKFQPARLPFHPAIEERFGIGAAEWKALVEAIFPGAQSVDSVILALSYCKARHLDPFKRNVHIVPIWDSERKRYVDTVWPGIGELRTTAFRTGQYAGKDETKLGPFRTTRFGQLELTHPEWAQVTVYRRVSDQRVAFAGDKVYFMEAVKTKKDGTPNSMWETRPIGQLTKCAEAAALRAAFPEELGNEYCDAEAHAGNILDVPTQPAATDNGASRADQLADRLQQPLTKEEREYGAGLEGKAREALASKSESPSPDAQPAPSAGGDVAGSRQEGESTAQQRQFATEAQLERIGQLTGDAGLGLNNREIGARKRANQCSDWNQLTPDQADFVINELAKELSERNPGETIEGAQGELFETAATAQGN